MTSTNRFEPAEVVRRGKHLYAESLRKKLEPLENGKYVVIDVHSGHYEVDHTLIEAIQRIEARIREPQLFIGRVGHPTAIKM